jgi:hypothetical protein
MTEGKKECKECLEQARLLDMSGSREAKHLAQISALRSLAGRMADIIKRRHLDSDLGLLTREKLLAYRAEEGVFLNDVERLTNG